MRRLARGVVRLASLPAAVASAFVCIQLVARIMGSVVWFLIKLPVARRVAVWRFSRRLREDGLRGDAANELVEAYSEGLCLFDSECEEVMRRA